MPRKASSCGLDRPWGHSPRGLPWVSRVVPPTKTDRFVWTPEAQEVLDKLKVLLTKAPILVPLAEGELLLLYVAATT